ncbi:hypothetical protein C7M84_012808 [Penaeus vannamei]|uniref:Uncharacterized protein n=1 Tax=Penaeus vannamei TaxID=6689 RepID=A0A423SXR1_PENVA|nr:hypothetical protein C7M84_012808 [Penaeus vannamei]
MIGGTEPWRPQPALSHALSSRCLVSVTVIGTSRLFLSNIVLCFIHALSLTFSLRLDFSSLLFSLNLLPSSIPHSVPSPSLICLPFGSSLTHLLPFPSPLPFPFLHSPLLFPTLPPFLPRGRNTRLSCLHSQMPYVATGHISAGIIVVCGFLDYETTILRLRGRCCGSNYVAIPARLPLNELPWAVGFLKQILGARPFYHTTTACGLGSRPIGHKIAAESSSLPHISSYTFTHQPSPHIHRLTVPLVEYPLSSLCSFLSFLNLLLIPSPPSLSPHPQPLQNSRLRAFLPLSPLSQYLFRKLSRVLPPPLVSFPNLASQRSPVPFPPPLPLLPNLPSKSLPTPFYLLPSLPSLLPLISLSLFPPSHVSPPLLPNTKLPSPRTPYSWPSLRKFPLTPATPLTPFQTLSFACPSLPSPTSPPPSRHSQTPSSHPLPSNLPGLPNLAFLNFPSPSLPLPLTPTPIPSSPSPNSSPKSLPRAPSISSLSLPSPPSPSSSPPPPPV